MKLTVRKRAGRGVLFVHSNFPAQFGFVAQLLQREGVKCTSICSPSGTTLFGVPALKWRAPRGTSKSTYTPATKAEADMLRGAAAAERAMELKKKGFDPLLIVGHPGWGETLFLKEVFPNARQISYGEFYYHSHGADSGFDPEFGDDDFGEKLKIAGKNATLSLAYADADRIISPTPFQASLIPETFRSKMTIIHEGVDVDRVYKRRGSKLKVSDDLVLDETTPVITFINRCFEPLRGYHRFMRALPRVLAEVPDAHVLLIGEAGERGYGMSPPNGRTWKDIYLEEVADRLDLSRVHFTGWLARDRMLAALSLSRAHVYFTYPFVMSWSLLEAMASECLVIGSDTAPVRDAVTDGENGILVDFFDQDRLAETLVEACRNPARFSGLRSAARETIVTRYNRKTISEPAWRDVIADTVAWT
ncbi:glycosyltransferase [Microbaculum marinum]|uniref:Glycosyltransferase n=1 Tax=Microbaculum marinum TaxID=1764581 RepID=A0AAW9RJD9_9HYPH